jgi:membrane protease YdiL (CAAX protease family)
MQMAEPQQDNVPPRDANFHWWEPAVAFFGGTLAGLVLTLVCGLAALVIAMRGGYEPSQVKLVALMQTSFLANHAALVVSDLGLAVVIWLIARRRMARPLAHYFPPAGARAVMLALAGGVALSLAINGGNEVLSRITHIEFHDSVVERALIPHDALQVVIAVFVVALFAPFVEEFFFRGLFFTWLQQRGAALVAKLTAAAGARAARKPMTASPATQARMFKAFMWLHQKGAAWFAIVVSALAFAAVHAQVFIHPGVQGWLYTIELFFAGIALGWCVVRTGSLRTSWALHAAFNAAAIVFSVLLP